MPSLTLKNIPVRLHSALKTSAKLHRRSLNKEAISLLEKELVPSKKVDVEAMLAREKELSDSFGFTTTPEEIEAAIQEGRRV